MTGRSRLLMTSLIVLFLLAAFAVTVFSEESIFFLEGKQLYEKSCARCHGDFERSAKTGRSMSRLRTAIRTLAQHRSVAPLTDEQILLIAIALKEGEE